MVCRAVLGPASAVNEEASRPEAREGSGMRRGRRIALSKAWGASRRDKTGGLLPGGIREGRRSGGRVPGNADCRRINAESAGDPHCGQRVWVVCPAARGTPGSVSPDCRRSCRPGRCSKAPDRPPPCFCRCRCRSGAHFPAPAFPPPLWRREGGSRNPARCRPHPRKGSSSRSFAQAHAVKLAADAVAGHVFTNRIRNGLQFLTGIAHRHPGSGPIQHGGVVYAVAKGGGVLGAGPWGRSASLSRWPSDRDWARRR